jgi:hypothetical protein
LLDFIFLRSHSVERLRKTMENDRITTTVSDFLRLSGIGMTAAYELFNSGRLQTIKIGKRRLVVLDSYQQLIKQQTATPPPKTPTPDRRSARRAE